MDDKEVLLTQEGYENLEKELDYLKLEKMTYDEILDKTINVENKTF